jgi:diguanylate cyclase (GGDEF)-like protein
MLLGELGELAMTFDGMAQQIEGDRQRLERIATHDELTCLPNRYWVRDRVLRLIEDSAGAKLAVTLLDVDGFKEINDSFGHPMGDQVLTRIARALAAAQNGYTTAARFGGDEFVIVAEGKHTSDDYQELARTIRDKLRRPIRIDIHEFIVTASIGIAVYPEHENSLNMLLQNPDAAMYRAKEEKVSGIRFYSPEMNEFSAARLKMRNLLSKAVSNNELVLHYQPKFAATTGNISGAEVFLRWKSDALGFVQPGEFIPIVERVGLIVEMGEWTLNAACAQLREWRDEIPEGFSIAINLSPTQFLDPDLVQKVLDAVKFSHIPASSLELEIAEAALIKHPYQAIRALEELRDIGIKVSVDDFGTGYSSLAYLKNLPIDALKIDKSFITYICCDVRDQAIVRAIVSLGEGLKLRVTAEGVETQEKLNALRELRCEEMQGYLFFKPLPTVDFLTFLQQHS